MKYIPGEFEKRWQSEWENAKLFAAADSKAGEKKYFLDMFPYPSGAGLHVGHPEGFTATDILTRYHTMKGANVLHPMGWDAFGLPAENYAIKTGRHPQETIAENIETFRKQIKSIGLAYDWDREINTSAPDYYRWTQWIFLQLYKNGLAYKKEAPVNWCDSCKTVLANEQAVGGKCERCHNEVVQKNLAQWFFKITDFAQDLLDGLDMIDWPESLKTIQRNWIGRSDGANVSFTIAESDYILQVFTTRPDTLFGATYMVIAPEHEMIEKLQGSILNLEEVRAYQQEANKKSELERTELQKEKTGIILQGVRAINPVNNQDIPIYVADYVLSTYGTGAIMAVPAHDERDHAFAKKYNLPIVEVINGGDVKNAAWAGDGELVNSDFLNGLRVDEAKGEMIEFLEKEGAGYGKTQYKLRDWLVSRQRYWGAPIPIIYCSHCGEVPVPEKDLPVILPDDVDFKPTGESPLKDSKSFTRVACPTCGKDARREFDTMDTFVCSSWYFFRYLDPHNDKVFADPKKIKYWLPVDVYVGGVEHAVLHLMYARFFTKALKKFGLIDFDEPFLKLKNQGIILGEDGEKMSKSRGNVVNPDEVVAEYGADAFRLYEMFMGPFEDVKPWSTKNIKGVYRFLEKVWFEKSRISSMCSDESRRMAHKTIAKVTKDIESFNFNTAISQMMICVNTFAAHSFDQAAFESLLQTLAPFAPHIAEELWRQLGHNDSIFRSTWPVADESLTRDAFSTIAVQVDGKVRGTIIIDDEEDTEDTVREKALAQENVKKWVEGKEVKKFLYVKGKIVNIITSNV